MKDFTVIMISLSRVLYVAVLVTHCMCEVIVDLKFKYTFITSYAAHDHL